MTDAELIDRFPNVAWRQPIMLRVRFDGPPHYACRLCIAHGGVNGRDVAAMPTDREVVMRHIREAHP